MSPALDPLLGEGVVELCSVLERLESDQAVPVACCVRSWRHLGVLPDQACQPVIVSQLTLCCQDQPLEQLGARGLLEEDHHHHRHGPEQASELAASFPN